MHLTQIDITKNKAISRKAKALYLRAFPKEERLPWWILWLNAHRKGVDLTAFMDGEQFCGFTSSVTVEGMHFLLFFAIEASLRRKGYGSAVLSQLRQEYPSVTLNVELLIPSATNLQERKNRIAFYRKSGFVDTGYHVWEVGGKFRVLSTVPSLEVKTYKRIFRKLSLGFWNVKIEEAGS